MKNSAVHPFFVGVLKVVLVVLCLGVAWQAAIVAFGVQPYIVPRPLAVVTAFIDGWRGIAQHAAFTLSAAALGLTFSALLASTIAISFALKPALEQMSMPVVLVFRSTPVAALAPIMTLIFGRGMSTSVAVVTIIAFFPILVNLMRGISSTDPNATELLHVYGASRGQQMRLIHLPFALPYLFTGLRVSGTAALLGAMLSEWITGSPGLGKLILDAGEMREIELLWAAVITSVAISLCVFWTTSAAETRLLRWKA